MPELLRAGDPAPDFELTDLDGQPVSLSALHGSCNVLLVLIRGLA